MIALIVFSAVVNGSSYYIDSKTILYAFMHTYKISEGTCKKTTEFSTSLIFKGENTGRLLLLINSLDEDLIICLLYQHHI